jgi:AraC-like DNA-binding protein
LAKIAVELERALHERRAAGWAGRTTPRELARGDGWRVADVLCTCGPGDRRFEEVHAQHSIAIVLAGTFQLRSPFGEHLLVPGSLMLGNDRQCFECGHEHGDGDRCVSFYFEPDFFVRAAIDAGARRPAFRAAHLPPARELASLVARVSAGVAGSGVAWEEVALHVLGAVVTHSAERARTDPTPSHAAAAVSRIIREIDREPEAPHTIAGLARRARLSPFHFLRTFERVVGETPHQYVRRTRLRHAAVRLASDDAAVIDIALDCGFGDISNFNRAFCAEFGVAPTTWRRRVATRVGQTAGLGHA